MIGGPSLYVKGDGKWSGEWLPDDWRGRLVEQARRLDWKTYGYPTGRRAR